MEDMSPAVAVTLSLGNPSCEGTGIANHVEVARLKLVTDTLSSVPDTSEVVATRSISNGHVGHVTCGYSESEVNGNEQPAPVETCEGRNICSEILPENGDHPISCDMMIRESDEDEMLVGMDDTNGTSSEEILPVAVEIENVGYGQIVAKAIILEETTLGSVPSGEIRVEAVSADSEISSDLKEVVFKAPEEKNGSRGAGKSVYELECIPLWGSVSICGKRPEMEDAVAAVPRSMKIPIKMLIGDRVIEGISESLTHLTGHFYAVYDGHGGSQVANYCRERIHLALAEEMSTFKNNFVSGSSRDSRQMQWEKTFTSCFLKVDDEIGGKIGREVRGTNGDISGLTLEPVPPETVGSTAVVALVCSSHIIVANCGDSRAVLCRGKEPIALSVDHKPNREDEYERIEAAGGKVIQWNGHRVFGVLAMSRSIGDRYLKPWIIPDPEVMFLPRAREDECLIIASDGLWDVMSNEEACEIARLRILRWHKKYGAASLGERGKGIDPAAQAAADYLSTVALQNGSKDNISVIVVDLKAQRKFKNKS